MNESQLTLTAEEREFLAGLLQIALRDMRVEEHRTRTPTYREHIIKQEETLISLLQKLGKYREE